MAKAARFSDKEVAKMRELRDRATTAIELRKALSVLLVSRGAGLDASRTTPLSYDDRRGERFSPYLGSQSENPGVTEPLRISRR